MIDFYAISYFLQRVQNLKNIKRGVYATVEDEIRISFAGLSVEQIRQNRDMILMADEHVVIKLRMPDKKHRLSKKDGYRLIYLVYKEREEVGLLDVYPKNGPMQQLDIDDKQLLCLVQQYLMEKERNILSRYFVLQN
jgi:mRNA-degrading endonuclease RelE of RelBE toxin-antitoxin system